MDELMSEASGLVLSNPVCETSARLDARSDCLPFESYVSSVGLLKSSILDSIKNRRIEDVEVIEAKISRRRRNKCRKDIVASSLQSQSLKTKKLETEELPSSSLPEDNSCEVIHESAVSNTPHATFSTSLNLDKPGHTSEETIEMNQTHPLHDEARKRVAENGLKLAHRKFSSTIFENCSTYDLACSEVLFKNDDVLSAGEPASSEERPTCKSDKPALLDEPDKPALLEEPQKPTVSGDTEEPVSLSDSFFATVTDEGDDHLYESYYRKRISSNRDFKTLIQLTSSLATEGDNRDKTSDAQPAEIKERRHNRRGRKRQKKKRKGSSEYTCPRCRVSYALSPDALGSTVRCLHCDLWSTVEPVFVKHEKMVWNVCRIC